MNAKTNPLNQNVTGNPYYDYLIHEVQVVCNCPTDKAMAIVSYVNSLGIYCCMAGTSVYLYRA